MTNLTNPTRTYRIEVHEDGQCSMTSLASVDPGHPAVYTTLRTFHGNMVLNWQEHMGRLVDSAQLMGFEFPVESDTLKSILRSLVDTGESDDFRLRIVAPKSARGQSKSLVISLETLPIYPFRGYSAFTYHGQRDQARAKNFQFTRTAEGIRSQFPAEAEEVLLVAESGEILEGLSSNFYAILNGNLYTASAGVLSGTTRTAVLAVAHQIGISTVQIGWSEGRLSELDEAFITSVSRGVLPITWINQHRVGDGNPGYLTTKIYAAYQDWVEAHLEQL